MSSNPMVPAIPVSEVQVMATAVAKSNLFGIKTPEQAMALMLIAQAEGLHPAIAARDYHVIQGRPALKADAMLARFQSAGGKVKWTEYTETCVTGVFSHPQGGDVEVTWTIEQAKKLGYLSKDNWKNFPRAMLRARCISEGIRTVYPGVVVGVYTPEEVEDFDRPAKIRDMGNAEVVEARPVQATADKDTAPSLPAYPQEQFDKNLPRWMGLIDAGKKSAADIIAQVSTRYTLTDAQKRRITDPDQEAA